MNVKLYKVRLVGGGYVWNYGNDDFDKDSANRGR